MIDNHKLVQLIKRIITTVQLDSYKKSDIIVQNGKCSLSLLKLSTGYYILLRSLNYGDGRNDFTLGINLGEETVNTSKIGDYLYYTPVTNSIIIDSTEYKFTPENNFCIQTAFSTEVYQYYNLATALNAEGIKTCISIRNFTTSKCTIQELNELYDYFLITHRNSGT